MSSKERVVAGCIGNGQSRLERPEALLDRQLQAVPNKADLRPNIKIVMFLVFQSALFSHAEPDLLGLKMYNILQCFFYDYKNLRKS